MTTSTLAAILASTIAAAFALGIAAGAAQAGGDDWDQDWTALTVSSSGTWGSATHASRTTAMMQAMAQCRERAGASASGCGSHTTTVRGAWTVAYACDAETFIVTARTFSEAHVAAINQEIELRDFERVEIGACRRIVTIGPDGTPAPAQALSSVVPMIPEAPTISASENIH